MAFGFPDDFPFSKRRESQPAAASAPTPAQNAASGPVFEANEGIPPQVARVQAAVRRSVGAPAPAASAPVGFERRRAARQTLVARATIKPESNYVGIGPMAAGYVSNISLKGIGFHTRRPLAVGESYHIKLEVGPMKWESRLRVVTCHPHPDSGTYDVGAEFIANELRVRGPRDGMAA